MSSLLAKCIEAILLRKHEHAAVTDFCTRGVPGKNVTGDPGQKVTYINIVTILLRPNNDEILLFSMCTSLPSLLSLSPNIYTQTNTYTHQHTHTNINICLYLIMISQAFQIPL